MEHTAAKIPPGLAATTTNNTRGFLDTIPPDARESYEIRREIHARLRPEQIRAPFAIALLTEQDARTLFGRVGGWQRLRERYPSVGSVIVVSLPGFNQAVDRAVLYVGRSCGPMCGTGKILYLSKGQGEWKVVSEAVVWLS